MLFLSIMLFMILFYTTYQMSGEYNKSVSLTKNFLSWDEAERTVSSGTTYLTDQVRLYIQTHEKHYADNFFWELRENHRREKALEFLSSHALHIEADSEQCYLKLALDRSNALATRETYAIRLVAEAAGDDIETYHPLVRQVRITEAHRLLAPADKFVLARELVFGVEYQQAKDEIAKLLKLFSETTASYLHQQQLDQSKRLAHVFAEQRILLAILFCTTIMTFCMIIILIIKPLQIYLNCIKNDRMLELVGAYEFKHLAFTYNDIFALKEHHGKMIQYKAEHDNLTGLLNRNAMETITGLLKNKLVSTGVLLIDVDHFKGINDTWGHEVGDQALCRVASLLQNNFRADDYCIRMGGDEFVVIVKGALCENEAIIKNKIAEINCTLQNPPKDFPKLSISVGVACSKHGFTDELMKQADTALYAVKEAGRCGCQFYHAKPQPK